MINFAVRGMHPLCSKINAEIRMEAESCIVQNAGFKTNN
jgi:hypothetical protein